MSDYKRGYLDGFKDGLHEGVKAARDNPYITQPAITPSYLPTTSWNGCNVCKLPAMELRNYVCPRSDCPTRIT